MQKDQHHSRFLNVLVCVPCAVSIGSRQYWVLINALIKPHTEIGRTRFGLRYLQLRSHDV